MDQNKQTEFFYHIFYPGLPRLGVGSPATTSRALDLIGVDLKAVQKRRGPEGLRILDLGCGTGGQTVQLAQLLDGHILALDNHKPYIDELQRRAQAGGVAHKIRAELRDVTSLTLEPGSFDLVWAEGSIFALGYKRGLELCHKMLAPGGLLAVSELSWLRPDPPRECREFFDMIYPAMQDEAANRAQARASDFEVLDSFRQPEGDWWDNFYTPLEERLEELVRQWGSDPSRNELLQIIAKEIDIRRRFAEFYGHVFYLLKKG